MLAGFCPDNYGGTLFAVKAEDFRQPSGKNDNLPEKFLEGMSR
jgi:hypothetical protein